MTFAILHLSDIHISLENDPILKRSKKVAATIFPRLPELDAIYILVSGDIAQSGQKNEYELARLFLDQVADEIRFQKPLEIKFLIAPGNHDCNFSGDQESRGAVISAAVKKGVNLPESFIATGVSVQKEFHEFKKSYEKENELTFEDPLWTTHRFSHAEKIILVDILNASWMSSMHEQQGGLLFPYERYENFSSNEVDLRIGVFHHPFSWYSQSNVHKFKTFMHGLEDFIFTGHEHSTSGASTDDFHNGECVYIAGAALQQRKGNDSAFNIIVVNLAEKKFIYETYSWADGIYSREEKSSTWQEYRKLPKRRAGLLALSLAWAKEISDPGATLKHPSGKELELEDIYVFPDLDTRDQVEVRRGHTPVKLNSKILLSLSELKKDVILEGDENSGKTRLLYRLYAHYHSLGKLPIFIRASTLKSSTPVEISKILTAAIIAQYGVNQKTIFEQTGKQEKVLLLDDLDGSLLNREAKKELLDILRQSFDRVIITVGENYELAEIFESDQIGNSEIFSQYKLSPLGHERRAELIRKWNSIGTDQTLSLNDLLASCDEAERLIEAARLQHVASTVPIFVLSLLQATTSGASKEILKSSFAHYYYFLVVSAFDKAGVRPNDLEQYIAACTHLSWFIKGYGDDQKITETQFNEFIGQYSAEWTETDGPELLRTLIASRLLEADGDSLYFTYPYAYYYFLGRYTSIIRTPEVENYLRYCMRNLYVRECANTLLFLAHHTSNSDVLDHLVAALDEHFVDHVPVTLSKADVATVAGLIAYAPAIKYKAQKPEAYRKAHAQKRDEEDRGGDELSDKPNGENEPRDIFQEVVSLHKSIEIAGALLTHQFPNYSRVKKEAAIRAIFDSSLRAIRMFFSHFEKDKEELIDALSFKMRSGNKEMTAEQAESATRTAIGLLLRFLSTMFLMKAGAHVGSKDISSNVNSVIGIGPTSAYQLIRLSQELQKPVRLPRLTINRLKKEEGDNVCVMGVLQLLVLQRMYMYETDYDDKDWAMTVFELGGNKTAIEMNGQKRGKGQWRVAR